MGLDFTDVNWVMEKLRQKELRKERDELRKKVEVMVR